MVDSVDYVPMKGEPLPSRSAMVRWMLGVVVFSTLGLTVAGLFGRLGWLLDLCNHFRFQYALVLTLTSVALVLLRSWRVLVWSLVGLAMNVGALLPVYLPVSGVADGARPALTVMHFNINTANNNTQGVVGAIASSGADLVFVQEVNQSWLDILQGELDNYELVTAEPRSDNFGIACFARADTPLQIDRASIGDITRGAAQVPAIELEAVHAGTPVAILSLHTLPPISTHYARARDASLAAAGEWAAAQDGPCIVIGDLNATPWSMHFVDLVKAGGLKNSQAGFGRGASWPAAMLTPGMIPIDHLLHSEHLVTTARRLGEAHGSDHLPLTVTLRWAVPADD